MKAPKRIKYKGQIYEAVELKENADSSIAMWNEDAGYYLRDGSYKPKIDIKTGAIILPKEIYDMWD